VFLAKNKRKELHSVALSNVNAGTGRILGPCNVMRLNGYQHFVFVRRATSLSKLSKCYLSYTQQIWAVFLVFSRMK